MRLWLRVRRVKAGALTIIGVVVTLLLVGDQILPLPNLLGRPQVAVRLALLLPLAVGIVVAWGLSSGDLLLEVVASRPLHLLDMSYAVVSALLTLMACVIVWWGTGTELALAAGRNALGYVGLTLIGRRVLGAHAAAVLPTSFVIAAALFGASAGRYGRWWAWPIASVGDPIAWISAVGVLMLGAVIASVWTDITAVER